MPAVQTYAKKESAMVIRPALSKGEMEVARVLWEIGPAAVRAIHEAVLKERECDFATVQTYLRRMKPKGMRLPSLKVA